VSSHNFQGRVAWVLIDFEFGGAPTFGSRRLEAFDLILMD